MKRVSDIDPELYLLRAICRAADEASGASKSGDALDVARFNIYAAFKAQDADAARRWCIALRAGINNTSKVCEDQKTIALGALAVIEAAIGGN